MGQPRGCQAAQISLLSEQDACRGVCGAGVV